jgi:3'-5' exoribonuclease
MTPKESLRYLERVADSLCVGGIASHVLDDDRFYLWSGSSRIDQHHYGKHGLVVHTAEVARLCISNNEYLGNKLDNTELFLSALFHDCGKMWDYAPHSFENEVPDYGNWISTPHKRTIHHISRSAIEWNLASYSKETCERYAYISEDLLNAVTHNILAHHGQRAWGSPVAPKTGAAWMLHLCDGISARMNDCDSCDPYWSVK